MFHIHNGNKPIRKSMQLHLDGNRKRAKKCWLCGIDKTWSKLRVIINDEYDSGQRPLSITYRASFSLNIPKPMNAGDRRYDQQCRNYTQIIQNTEYLRLILKMHKFYFTGNAYTSYCGLLHTSFIKLVTGIGIYVAMANVKLKIQFHGISWKWQGKMINLPVAGHFCHFLGCVLLRVFVLAHAIRITSMAG